MLDDTSIRRHTGGFTCRNDRVGQSRPPRDSPRECDPIQRATECRHSARLTSNDALVRQLRVRPIGRPQRSRGASASTPRVSPLGGARYPVTEEAGAHDVVVDGELAEVASETRAIHVQGAATS